MTPRMLVAAVLVLAIALFGLGHCAGSMSADLAGVERLAAAEARALKAAGALTAEIGKRNDLEAAAATLGKELERARAAVSGGRVVEVVSRDSGESPVARDAAPIVDAPPAGPGCPARPDCLVDVNSTLRVRVFDARIAGDSGAEGLVGRAEVWRVAPAPVALVWSQPFNARLSEWKRAEDASRAVARPLPRWSFAADYGPGAVGAGLERRLVGGLWAGAVAGVVRGEAYIAGRVRLEWGK